MFVVGKTPGGGVGLHSSAAGGKWPGGDLLVLHGFVPYLLKSLSIECGAIVCLIRWPSLDFSHTTMDLNFFLVK